MMMGMVFLIAGAMEQRYPKLERRWEEGGEGGEMAGVSSGEGVVASSKVMCDC